MSVKNFIKDVRRVSLQEHPLAPGSIAIVFTEAEEGKPFSELIQEILKPTNVKDTEFEHDVFNLKYWLQVEIKKSPTQEDLQDLRYGLHILDEASIKHRVDATDDVTQKIKESHKRTSANLLIKGLFETNEYDHEFDTCVLDTSELSTEEVKQNAIYVAEVSQRLEPTTFIISTELANQLLDKEFKETTVGKVYSAKVKFKSVFAPKFSDKVALENPFVREIA